MTSVLMLRKTLSSHWIWGRLAALALACHAGGAFGQSEPAPVKRAVIEKYLFLPQSDTYLVGDRVTKWESDLIVVLYREDERLMVERLVAEIHRREALGPVRILLLPPIDRLADGAYDRPNFTLGVNSAHFEFMMAPGALAGLEDYQANAKAAGCYAQPTVPFAKRDYLVTGGQIMARDDLAAAALSDCIFRGFLINAGLMYTPRLAADPTFFGAAERAEALSVLKLLYHPAVSPGMDRAAFYRALAAAGLLAD